MDNGNIFNEQYTNSIVNAWLKLYLQAYFYADSYVNKLKIPGETFAVSTVYGFMWLILSQ